MAQAPRRKSETYLTVVAWPQGREREQVVELLARSLEVDRPTVRIGLRSPPDIFGEVDTERARRAIDALVESGGDAFACTLDDIAALGPTLKIKDLRTGSRGLEAELWRGPLCTILPREIDVVVRARLSEGAPRAGPSAPEETDAVEHVLEQILAESAFVWGPVWATSARSPPAPDEVPTPGISHKLDVHTVDGRVFQIDGDKFGYRILGDLRGHGDNANIDRMCELLCHLNPETVVDGYFSLWKPPRGYARLRLPLMRVNNEDHAFAFYSRWAALLYRHAMGTAAAS